MASAKHKVAKNIIKPVLGAKVVKINISIPNHPNLRYFDFFNRNGRHLEFINEA